MQLPPYCPNTSCVCNQYESAALAGKFWILKGVYVTAVSGAVQRFKCKVCGTGFSERTCSIDYYAKKNLDYREIHRATSEGESVSAIARHLGCNAASVTNRQDRLGRNCLAMHARLLEGHALSEDLCADGFESFDRSQYFPSAINILVGEKSQYLYGNSHATLRRKGRMTETQRKKRDQLDRLFRPRSAAVTESFTRLLQNIDPMWKRERRAMLVLRTDEHPAYPRAIRRVEGLSGGPATGSFIHETHSSRIARTVGNPLFPVNYYDRELRKDIAAYRRESTCFGRNVSNGLLRFADHMVWHNYLKPFRIVSTAKKPATHAIVAGIDAQRIKRELGRLYRDRAFLSHQRLNDESKTTWLKAHPTPLAKRHDYCPHFVQVDRVQGSGN